MKDNQKKFNIESHNKFQVHDRVRIIKLKNKCGFNKLSGQTGMIKECYEFLFYIHFDSDTLNEKYSNLGFYHYQLIQIEEEEKTEEKKL